MAPFIDPYKSRLRIVGVKRQEASFLRLLLGDVIAVDDAGPPDLVWDVKRSVVVSAVGDVVARLQDMQTSVMRGIIGKWNLLATVRALSERSNLRLQLHPGDGVHAEGTPLRFTMDRHEYRFLTLFNLASDGTVNFIFPNNADSIVDKQSSLEIRTDQRYQLKLEATEPFGADHLVTVVSDVPLLKLHEILRFADGKLAAPLLRTALLTSVKDINYQIGVLGFYTGPVD